MANLLKVALENQRYDLAAYVLVFGLIKVKQNDQKKHAEKQKARVLQQGTGRSCKAEP
jgi:hypothetical protein